MSIVDNINPEELHPRTTISLAGHAGNADIFLKSVASGRLHHGWLLAGPKGIGKATFAYHCARYLLKGAGDNSLIIPEDDPVFTHVTSGAEGNLKVIERGMNEKTGRMRQEIVVDDVRGLHDFFEKTAMHAGWRIAILDSADEMNRSAANALLKMLEEPPKQTILFLVSHARGRLPATVRSRCQQLLFNPLKDDEVARVLEERLPGLEGSEVNSLAGFAQGSPGFAIRLAVFKGVALIQTVTKLFEGEGLKTEAIHKLAGDFGRRGADEQYFLFLDIVKAELSKRMREDAINGRKSRLDCWLALWDKVEQIQREGEGLNLGRKQQLILLLEDLKALKARLHKAA